MDKIEEEAIRAAKEAQIESVVTEGPAEGPAPPPSPHPPPPLGPPEGVVTQEDPPPVSIETSLPSQEMTGVAGPERPEPGFIRGQLMRQAAVLSEMDAFLSQNHGFLADDALVQLKVAQNSIRAAWRSLLVAAVKLKE